MIARADFENRGDEPQEDHYVRLYGVTWADYLRCGAAYEAVAASEALPGIDLDQLVSFLDRPTASQAIRDYRAALRAAEPG